MTTGTGTNTDFSRGFELLKRVYADKVEDMVPETDRLSKDIPFINADKQPGQDYVMPVTLTREGGATFWNDGSIKTLNQPLSTAELSASVRGSEIAIRSALSYKFMHTALKQLDGTRAGARAFVNATKDRFEKLSKGGSYFRECMLLYGGGTGAVGGGLGIVANTTGSAGTTLTVQMAAADYATAIWAGSEGLEYDIFSTGGVKRNTAGTTSDTVFKLTGTDPTTYRVTFTSHATNVAAVVATDQIFFAGARGNDALGLVAAANTQAGNLWGISTATYGLWKPTVVPVNGMLTFERVMAGAATVAAIGYFGDYDLYLNPASFQDVCNDQTALVTQTKTSGTATIGFDDVVFKSQAGSVYLKAHPYIKRGIALGIPRDYAMRVGSTDLTHTMPGFGKMFRELENASGVEMRLYTDQAPFVKHPSYLTLFTGITNTTD